MPDHVITHVEQLGRRDGQPNLLTFTDRQGQELLDEPANPTSIANDDDLSLDATVDVPITGVNQPATTSATAPEITQRRILDTAINTPGNVRMFDFSDYQRPPNDDAQYEPDPVPENNNVPAGGNNVLIYDDDPHEHPPPVHVHQPSSPKFTQVTPKNYANPPEGPTPR